MRHPSHYARAVCFSWEPSYAVKVYEESSSAPSGRVILCQLRANWGFMRMRAAVAQLCGISAANPGHGHLSLNRCQVSSLLPNVSAGTPGTQVLLLLSLLGAEDSTILRNRIHNSPTFLASMYTVNTLNLEERIRSHKQPSSASGPILSLEGSFHFIKMEPSKIATIGPQFAYHHSSSLLVSSSFLCRGATLVSC